jgi:hypothetical protein
LRIHFDDKKKEVFVMRKVMCCLTSAMAVVMLIGFSIGVVHAGPCELPDLEDYYFDSPQSNPYLPIPDPGTTYVYEAEDEDGLIVNYIQFTDVTIPIMGVDCTVVYDVEYLQLEDGSYVKLEETWDWHAWDNDGNYWYFGEDTTEYEYNDEWELTGCNNDGAWKAGEDVADVGAIAEPGIILPAEPTQGDCYKQEYYEGEAEDVGKVLKVKAKCEDPDGNESEECMVMKEWTALEPGNIEHKIYYPGKGLVHIKELKEKTVEVDLVEIRADIPDLGDFEDCPED